MVREVTGHTGYVSSLAPCGGAMGCCTFASGSYDRTVRLWDLESGTPLQQWCEHQDCVNQVHFCDPLARNLLGSCSWDGTLKLWDVRVCSLPKRKKNLLSHPPHRGTPAYVNGCVCVCGYMSVQLLMCVYGVTLDDRK